LPIADCRLPIADCRLPIADFRFHSGSRPRRGGWKGRSSREMMSVVGGVAEPRRGHRVQISPDPIEEVTDTFSGPHPKRKFRAGMVSAQWMGVGRFWRAQHK